MRLNWKPGLTASFVAIMLLALGVSQCSSVLLSMDEKGDAIYRSAKAEFLSRAASVAKVLEGTPAVHRDDILAASGTNYSRFWVSAEFPSDPVAWSAEAKQRLSIPLPPPGQKNAESPAGFRPDPVAPGTEAATGSGHAWVEMPAHAWPLSRAAKFLRIDHPGEMGLSVMLQDGTWLNTAFSKNMSSGMWTSRSMISLALTALILSIGAAFIARGITSPMRRLAAAAEALGRGETIRPLPETGPQEVRQTAEAFNRMQARLQRFVEDRTRMLAAIGHDLRTPITSLRLRAEFVSDDETREKMLATLDELNILTEATLAFSKDQALAEPTRNVDIGALVESLCDDLCELGHDVRIESAPKFGYRCRADALRRALRNLIENAVRYGNRARVSIIPNSAGLSIVVDDDGPGIPPDVMDQVFEPFFRLESSRCRDTGGIGLGLSIARDIVRNHGGDIQLINTETGLRANIKLPHLKIEPKVGARYAFRLSTGRRGLQRTA